MPPERQPGESLMEWLARIAAEGGGGESQVTTAAQEDKRIGTKTVDGITYYLYERPDGSNYTMNSSTLARAEGGFPTSAPKGATTQSGGLNGAGVWNTGTATGSSASGSTAAAKAPTGAISEQELRDAGAQFGLGIASVGGFEYRKNVDGSYSLSGRAPAQPVPKISPQLQQAQQALSAQDLRAKANQARDGQNVDRSPASAPMSSGAPLPGMSPQFPGSPGTEGWNKPSIGYGIDQQGRATPAVYNRPNPGGGGTMSIQLTPGMLGQLLGPFGTTPTYDPKTRQGDPMKDIAAWEAMMGERARRMSSPDQGGMGYDALTADQSFLGRKDAGPYAYGNSVDQSGRNMGPGRGYQGLYGADRATDPGLSVAEWLAMVTPEETTDGYEPYDPQSFHAGGQVIANQNGYFGRGNGYGPPPWVFDYLGGGGPAWAQQMQAPMLARGGSVQASPYTTVGGRNIAGWDDPQSRNYQAGSPVQESRDPMFGWARGREDNRRGSGGGGAGAVVSNWLPDKRYWVEGYGWLTEAQMQALGIDQTAGGDFQWESSLSKSPPLGGTTGVPSFAGGTNGPLITDEPMLGIGANSGDLRFTVGEPNALTGGAPTREMITGGNGTMNVTPMEPSVPMGPMANPMMPTAFAQLVESLFAGRKQGRTPPLRPVGAASMGGY